MFKSARSRLRAAVFACAAALGLGAYAATPVAVWDGDFNVTEKNGVTFYANGNTVAEDGSTVTISSDATVAPYVILPKTYRYTSIAFTVSNLLEGTDKLVVLFGAGSTPNATGVYLSGAEGLTTSGVNWGGKWNTTTYDGTLTTGAGDRTFVATYDSGENGTHLYEAGAGSSDPIFGGGGNNNLRYANTMCDTIAIGGGKSVLTGLTPLTGLVIKKIAVYTSTSAIPVAQSEIAAYAIPAATTIAVPAKMSAFNEEVANATGVINITGTETAVELDVEPSDAAKAILQNADVWRGTVLIKDTDKNAIVPTAYGNPNSTLKLSGVKGYFAKAQYAATATPAIELEDSTTEGREYGLWQYDGFSYNANGGWAYVATPELKGSGTLKCNKDVRPLLLVGKWSAFTGTLNLSAGGAVWFGLDVPAQDSALVTSAMVKFNGALPSGIAGWTYAKASGTVTQTAVANSDQVAFFTNSKWTGTCKIQFGHNGDAFDIVNYGNANSVVEIVSTFSAYPTQNGGNEAANLAAELKLSANWTVANGWDNKTTTFAKLSGTGNLIVNGTSSSTNALPYTITKIENFTGALGGARGQFTIGTIVATEEPVGGTKLVSLSSCTKTPVLTNTTVEYNGAAVEGIALKVKSDGIYVAEPTIDVTVPVVANTVVTVTVGGETVPPTVEGGHVYAVAPGSVVTVTYAAADGYKISGTTVYTVNTANATTFEVAADMATAQYVAQIRGGDSYTTLQAALNAATRNSKIIVLANETDGATIPSADNSFYIYTGEFETGEILDATGDYITTRTIEEISISDDYHADKVTATKYSVAAAFMAVTIDGTRTLYGEANANDALTAANAGAIGTKIEFLSGDPASYAEILPMFDYDSETGVYTKVANPVVAVYSGVQQLSVHRTLAEAVAAAENGLTVKLLADVANTTYTSVPSAKSLTLDLGGFTLSSPSYGFVVWGDLTITNGTVSATYSPVYISGGSVVVETDTTLVSSSSNAIAFNKDSSGGSLVVNGGSVTAREFCVQTGYSSNNMIVINGGTFTSIDNAVIGDNGTSGYSGNTFTINGGTFNGGITTAGYVACGVYIANDDTLVVNGGTFNITGGCGILARAGKVNVSGTAVINTTGTATGKVGDSRVVVPCAPIVYDSAANYPGYDETTTTFAVSGGTFTADGQDVDCIVQVADEGDATSIAVSGGTFNTAVADTYCANGYEPKDNGNGTYGVRVDKGWIYEDADFPNYTGAWSKDGVALDLVYDSETGKAAIEDGATYTASKPSAGQLVTINLSLSFDAANSDDDVHEGAKAAVRLGAGETNGTYVFQLYTTNETGTAAWLDATASGVTPTVDQDYAFTFVLDMTNRTYTATVGDVPLTVNGAETLGFADATASDTVQSIEFAGAGKVTSIKGSYEDIPVPEGFVADEKIGGVTLTAAQADWLNGQGNYDALAAKLATMTQPALDNAYLLNLNIAGDFSYEFGVSDFKVDTATGKATVYVTLTRTGALAENEVAKPIIGTLKLTGTAEIGTAFAEIGSADLIFDANVGFGNGATTTAVTVDIGKDGTDAKFYQPVIVAPAAASGN